MEAIHKKFIEDNLEQYITYVTKNFFLFDITLSNLESFLKNLLINSSKDQVTSFLDQINREQLFNFFESLEKKKLKQIFDIFLKKLSIGELLTYLMSIGHNPIFSNAIKYLQKHHTLRTISFDPLMDISDQSKFNLTVKNLNIILDNFILTHSTTYKIASVIQFLYSKTGWKSDSAIPIIDKFVQRIKRSNIKSLEIYNFLAPPSTNLTNPTLLQYLVTSRNLDKEYSGYSHLLPSHLGDLCAIFKIIPLKNNQKYYENLFEIYIERKKKVDLDRSDFEGWIQFYNIIFAYLTELRSNQLKLYTAARAPVIFFDIIFEILEIPPPLVGIEWKTDMTDLETRLCSVYNVVLQIYLEVTSYQKFFLQTGKHRHRHRQMYYLFSNIILVDTFDKILEKYPWILVSLEFDEVVDIHHNFHQIDESNREYKLLKLISPGGSDEFLKLFLNDLKYYSITIPNWNEKSLKYLKKLSWEDIFNIRLTSHTTTSIVQQQQALDIVYQKCQEDESAPDKDKLLVFCNTIRYFIYACPFNYSEIDNSLKQLDYLVQNFDLRSTFVKSGSKWIVNATRLWDEALEKENLEDDQFADYIPSVLKIISAIHHDSRVSLTQTQIQNIKNKNLRELLVTYFESHNREVTNETEILKEHYKKLITQGRRESGICLTCLTNQREWKFPCGHVAICTECLERMPEHKCLVCRQRFLMSRCERIYLS